MSPGEIVDFVLSLRRTGSSFDIGLPQYYEVHDLLLALARRGELPTHPDRLKTLLAPLLCSNSDQQADFYHRFEERFASAPPTIDAATEPHSVTLRSILRSWRLAAVTAGILVIAVVVWLSRPVVRPHVPPSAPADAPAANTGSGVAAKAAPPAGLSDVEGVVQDENGSPIQGASVLYSPGRTVSSDVGGTFRISVPSNVPTRFLITHVDYRPSLVDYPGNGTLTVSLVETDEAKGRFQFAPVQGGPYASREAALAENGGALKPGTRLLPATADPSGASAWYVVSAAPVVTAHDLQRAAVTVDENNRPALAFTLAPDGARRLAEHTTGNIGKQLAIIVNNEVLSAPRVEGRIDAEGQISGSFTTQEVADLAAALQGRTPEQPRDWRALLRPYLPKLKILAAVFPFAVMLAFWTWVWHRRRALRRWVRPRNLDTRKLGTDAAMDALFPSHAVRGLGQDMRRRTPRMSTELAAAATVHATVRQAGYFTPVYAERRVAPEYLVLVERTGPRDQQAQLTANLLSRLAAADVLIHVFYYAGDPRACVAAADERLESAARRIYSLEELAALHVGHRLWIFGAAQALVDPLSGRPHRWTSQFSLWDSRVVFNTAGSPAAERALRAHGFQVSAAGLDRMRAAVDVTLEEGARVTSTDPPAEFPDVFRHLPQRWFSSEEPPPGELSEMLAATRRFLGPRAYDCLCGCAVYPQVSLHITLELARRFLSENERYEAVQRIVRLPWMRYGFVPDWLRGRFLRRMHPTRLAEATAVVTQLLDRVREDRVLTGWLDFLRRKAAKRGPDGVQPDYVFLSILWGRKPDDLAFRPPRRLSSLLFREGDVIFGLRPLVHVAVSAAIAGALWTGTTAAEAYLQTTAAPAPGLTMDELTRRVVEIAESQSGTTHDSGKWTHSFVDWCFDQAAQLLGEGTPLLAPIGSSKGVAYRSEPFYGGVAENSIVTSNDSIGERAGAIVHVQTPSRRQFADYRPDAQPVRTIAIVSESAKVTFEDVRRFAAAAQTQIDRDLSRFWRARAVVRAHATVEDAGADAWTLIVRDDIGRPGTAGYHSDQNGKPFAFVDAAAGPWTLSASRELLDMLVNPFSARVIRGPAMSGSAREVLYLAEITDPVHGQDSYSINGMIVSNFVSPRWFYDLASFDGAAYDFNGRLRAPREILPGGFATFGDPATGRWAEARVGNGMSVVETAFQVEGLNLKSVGADSGRRLTIDVIAGGLGELRVRVLDLITGAPVARATVTVLGVGSTTITTSSGEARLRLPIMIKPGSRVSIEAKAAGYSPLLESVMIPLGQ